MTRLLTPQKYSTEQNEKAKWICTDSPGVSSGPTPENYAFNEETLHYVMNSLDVHSDLDLLLTALESTKYMMYVCFCFLYVINDFPSPIVVC